MAYNPNNKISAFFSRTNKLANESNALQMKVERQSCDQLEFDVEIIVDSGANTLTINTSAPTNAYDFRYFQAVVSDEDGNHASNTGTGVIASLVVDTTELNVNKNWYLTVYASDDTDVLTECGCKSFAEIEIDSPSTDPTITVNTEFIDAQKIGVLQADGSTPVVDGGAAYDLGSYAAGGGSESQSILVKNDGKFVLKLSAVGISADVDGVTFTNPTYVYPNQSVAIAFTVDTSGGAGAKTGSLTITSDDPSNPSYVVNVAFTLT